MSIKERLIKGEAVYGAMICEIRNPNIMRIYKSAGLDFAIVDMEHGPFSFETMADMVGLAKVVDIAAFVRVPDTRRESILKPLDCGAAGIIVPQIDTAEDIKKVVEYAKYSPLGDRGRAFNRSHTEFEAPDPLVYCAEANRKTMVIAMIETASAVENLDGIMSVEGVDGAFLGPADLCASMGIEPASAKHPNIVAAIEKEIEVCKKYGKAAGIHLFDIALLSEWISKGITFSGFHTDISFMRTSITSMLSKMKNNI